MAYEVFSPESLDQLNVAQPADNEDASLLAAAERQSRQIVKNVLLKEHNADGSHKSVDTALGPNSVTGDKLSQHATDDNRRAVGTNHIKDGAITAAKLGVQSIDGNKIVDGSIPLGKLGVNAVAQSNIAAQAVDGTKLAQNAVGPTNIAPNAVQQAHMGVGSVPRAAIVAAAVDETKLSLAGNLLFVGGAQAVRAAAVGGALQMVLNEATNPPTATFNVAPGGTLLPIVAIYEVGTTGGRSAAANTWTTRPADGGTSSFGIQYDQGQLAQIGVSPKRIILKQAGTYLVYMQAVAYKCQLHQARLYNITRNLPLIVGSLADADVTAAGQSATVAFGIIVISDDLTEVELQHWTEGINSGALNLFGRSPTVANGATQVLASLVLMKLE